MYGEKMEISDEALEEDFVIPFGLAKIERPGMSLILALSFATHHFCCI